MAPVDTLHGDTLHGKEVSLTGRLASMKRAEAIRRITEAGGRHVDIPGGSTRGMRWSSR